MPQNIFAETPDVNRDVDTAVLDVSAGFTEQVAVPVEVQSSTDQSRNKVTAALRGQND
jgi:hypothetical protein